MNNNLKNKNITILPDTYRRVFDLSPVAIILLDSRGKIIDINHKLYEWLGFLPKDIIGHSIGKVSFIKTKSKLVALKRFAERKMGRDIPPYDLVFTDKKGIDHIGEVSGVLIKDDQGKMVADLVMISDVTNQRAVENDLKKFKLAVEGVSDHIVITDSDGYILYANDAVEKITGFERREIIGKKAGNKTNWGGRMGKSFYKGMWHRIKDEKKPFVGELSNVRKDGRQYISLASVSPILSSDKKVRFFVGIERDITKEKEIDQAKTEFVSLASHQLRTPLSTINWYSEMLLDGDVGELNKEQKGYLNEIYKGNQRMVDLVNALLNVSRLELGTFVIDPEKIKISDIAKSVINEMHHQIVKRNIKLTKKFDDNVPAMMLDRKLIRMVIQNLLSNAVKYTPKGGKVSVTIKQNKTKKRIEIIVTDNGIGIPKYQQEKIFTKLFRADNVKELDTEGTGLGLYIVKSIIEHSGGMVWFDTEEKKGTSFYVTLPLGGMSKKAGTKELN